MGAVFELDHSRLAGGSRFAAVAEELTALGPIDSRESFDRYCREACRLWEQHLPDGAGRTSPKFGELMARIQKGGDSVIPTSWGGVAIEVHEPPRVEKFLVIRRGGYLALETHEEKDERLEVTEGAGLILFREIAGKPLTVRALLPGERFHFEPGFEHCIIGTENILVFERSIDPKGMDQDLVFIYEPL